jgi:hypothetical protein
VIGIVEVSTHLRQVHLIPGSRYFLYMCFICVSLPRDQVLFRVEPFMAVFNPLGEFNFFADEGAGFQGSDLI